MSLEIEIITDLAVIMTVAAIVTFLFTKLRQPLVLGYLIAGIIIGPYTPPFSLIRRTDFLGVAAELGVILLLFGIGLEFPLTKLRAVGKVAVGVAAIEITFMLLISYIVGSLLHWSFMDTIFLGAALASSSTTIIAKVLTDLGKLKETPALIMLGVLVVEDLFVVLLLAILQSVASTGTITPETIFSSLLRVTVFIFGTLVIGSLVIPRIVDRIAAAKQTEVLLLTALGLCFGLSIVATELGLSVAIGAFIMGVLVASAKSAAIITELTLPLKNAFGAMFFVSIGALIDLSQFHVFLAPALIITSAIIIAKVLGCTLGTRAFHYNTTTSIMVGLGMAQIGEFAFIVVKAGEDLNVISSFLFPTIGVVAAITTFLTPYLIKLSYSERLQTRMTQSTKNLK